jgi:hypothetical protein
MGPIIFIIQLLLYPYLSNRFSALSLWRISAMASAVVYPLFSLLPRVTENEDEGKFVLWSFLLLLLMVRFAANVVG